MILRETFVELKKGRLVVSLVLDRVQLEGVQNHG